MNDDNASQTQLCLWFAHDAHPESPSQGDAEDPGQISFTLDLQLIVKHKLQT